MLDDQIRYGLLAALAIALLVAAFTDLRSRHIGNWLNLAIALAAPLFWWAGGWTGEMSLWPDVAMQLGLALLTFGILCGLFALGQMGGGDVKLLTALALWVAPLPFLQLLVAMALVGGALTVLFGAWHIMRRRKNRLTIPYGVAISTAGLWVLGTTYLQTAAATGNLG